MTRWRWLLSQILRKLWLRTTAYGLLGVFTAIVAIGFQRLLPWEIPELVGAESVGSLLNIIASSMLAVTTFSLSAMTAAYSAATSNVTPRATSLLIEDTVTQRVLSTFVGSFIFSIVGIIVLQTGAYGPSGRTVLFVVTVIVVVLIVINLLRWIDHITGLGRVGETTVRVEEATRAALEARLASPYLGGIPLLPEERNIPSEAMKVCSDRIGYIQHIDMYALSKVANAYACDIHILCNPGAFIATDRPLAWLVPAAHALLGDDGGEDKARRAMTDVRAAFTVGTVRSFDQDPRFGLAVMSEIASRALSSATNDPGTALDVIGRNTRLLALWARGDAEADGAEPQHPRLHVPPLTDDDLFEDAFMLIARDGAGLIEIQLRLQKCLAALAQIGPASFRSAAKRQAELALARARHALQFSQDLDRLQQVTANLPYS